LRLTHTWWLLRSAILRVFLNELGEKVFENQLVGRDKRKGLQNN